MKSEINNRGMVRKLESPASPFLFLPQRSMIGQLPMSKNSSGGDLKNPLRKS